MVRAKGFVFLMFLLGIFMIGIAHSDIESVDISVSPQNPSLNCEGVAEVTFTANVNYNGSENLTYNWKINGESFDSGSVSYNFTSAGNYTIELNVSQIDNNSDIIASNVTKKTITISPFTGSGIDVPSRIDTEVEIGKTNTISFTIENKEEDPITLDLSYLKDENDDLARYNDLKIEFNDSSMTLAACESKTLNAKVDASRQDTIIERTGGKI
jgi:PKD repeat protein